MTGQPGGALWLHLLAALAVGGTTAAGLAGLLAWAVRAPAWQRAVWRAGEMALAGLFVAEVTGMAGSVLALGQGRFAPGRVQESGPAVPDEATGIRVEVVAPSRTEGEPTFGEPLAAPGPREASAVAAPGDRGVWWPGVVWVVGAAVVGGRLVAARVLLALWRRRRPVAGDAALAERVRSVAGRLGLRRRVRVVEAEGLAGPAAFGVLRPTVVLPAGFADRFTAAQQEAVLAHELAHLAAWDPAWHLLADVTAALWWWHPAAWWVRRRQHAAAEAAADEASLVVEDGPAVLAACLVELGGRLAQARPIGGVPMGGPGFRSGLGRRVERLTRLGGRPWRPPGRVRSGVVLTCGPALLLAAAVLSSAWARPQASLERDIPMRTFQQTWRRSLTGMIVWAALGTGGAAAADEPAAPAGGGKPEGAAAPQDPLLGRPHRPRRAQTDSPAVVGGGNSIGPMPPAVPSEPLRIKVFRLSHRDPEEVLAVLSCRFDGIGQPNGVYLPSITADRGKESATSGGGGVAGVRGPVLVGIPGGMGGGGPFGMAVPAGVAAVRVVVDYRTRSLVARGPEKELKALADTVARLDMAPGKPQPALKELRIFRLRHTGVNDVAQVLTSLGLTGVRMAMVARTNSLVVAGPEATLKEIAETVQALDVEVPAKKEGNAKSPAGPVQ